MTFIAGLGVISIFGRLLGPALLAEYLLIRRVAGWLNAAQLGLGVGLPRYVARASGSKGKQESYFVAAAVCLGIFSAALLLPFNLLPTTFGQLFFGDPRLKNLVPPLSMFFLGLMAHGVVYGYYRGCLRMGLANALQCWNLGVIPLLSVGALFRTHSVGRIVSAMGALTILSSVLFAVPILHLLFRRGYGQITRHAAELLRYGVPRVLGDFSGGALFALGPIFGSHYVPMDEVASLLLGISILLTLSVSTGPLGLILLSKVTMMLAQSRREEVRSQLKYLIVAVVELSTFMTVQILVFTDVLVRACVGHAFPGHAFVIRIVLIATPFYLLISALRSVIDAASHKAYTARNGLVSLGVFLVLTGLAAIMLPRHLLLEGIASALLLALITLAWLTQKTVRQLFEVSVSWRSSIPSFVLTSVLGLVALLMHWTSGFQTGVLELVIIETAFSLVFTGALIWLDSPWVQFFWKTAFAMRIATVA